MSEPTHIRVRNARTHNLKASTSTSRGTGWWCSPANTPRWTRVEGVEGVIMTSVVGHAWMMTAHAALLDRLNGQRF